jgi:hypothetical protein
VTISLELFKVNEECAKYLCTYLENRMQCLYIPYKSIVRVCVWHVDQLGYSIYSVSFYLSAFNIRHTIFERIGLSFKLYTTLFFSFLGKSILSSCPAVVIQSTTMQYITEWQNTTHNTQKFPCSVFCILSSRSIIFLGTKMLLNISKLESFTLWFGGQMVIVL